MQDDPYISEELIATGPSAKLYRGHDLAAGHLVRIKALLGPTNCACPIDHDSIRSYPAPLLALQHPQICRFLAFDEHGEDLSLITEFSPGRNLWAFVAEQPVPAPDVRALATQLLMALQACESVQLCHSDVKPSNVIINGHPGFGCTLQLQDIGVAASRAQQPHETLQYRAPELLEGGSATLASDLFSAGATLATLILGHPLVDGDSEEQLHAAWQAFDPMMIRHARPDIDTAFHDWLVWMLRFDPAHRPANATAAISVLSAPPITGPLMPMYQPVAWQAAPHATAPLIPAPPPSPAAKPPTQTLQRRAPAKTDQNQTALPPKKRRGFPFAIVFTLFALLVVLGFFAWIVTSWGDDWPTQLRRQLVQLMGGSVEETTTTTTSTVSPSTKPVSGRYVRIQIPGQATLNLAEVEVFSNGINIAPKGRAIAQDTAWGGSPEKANDGNTDGDWAKKSIYHSKDKAATPWWEVDLGSEQPIQAVKVWNRTDGKYADRLKDYAVIIFDKQHQELWRIDYQPTPHPSARHDVASKP